MRFFFCLTFFIVFFLSCPSIAALDASYGKAIPQTPARYRSNLNQLARQSGAKGDYFRLIKAERSLKQNDKMTAFKLVSKVNDPLFKFWKDVVLGEIYLAQAKPRETLAVLRHLPGKPVYELAYGEGVYENLYKRALMARYLAAKSIGQEVEKEAAMLLSLFPLDRTVDDVVDEADKNPRLNKEQKVDKLLALHRQFKFKDMVVLLTAAEIKSSGVDKKIKCRALNSLASAQKTQKGYRDIAIQTFQDVIHLKCDGYAYPRALYWLGSLKPEKNSALPDNRKAALKRLFREYSGHRLADDALYKLYKIAEDEGNGGDAKKYFKELMSLEKGDMKSVLAYDLAWPLYQKGKYKRAAEVFSQALNTKPTGDENYPRVLYWYARSLEKTEDKKNISTAKKSYQKLVKDFPFSFYAILAARRLNKNVKTPPLPRGIESALPEDGMDSFLLIDEFNLEGYHDAARAVLDLALHEHPEWEKQNQEYITKLMLESQNFRKALELASDHFKSGVYGPIEGAPNDPVFEAHFPWAFQNETKIGYQNTSLPKGAIEGIIREESLFQRSARSWVGATGLMQLMPSTAAMVRKKLLMPHLSDDIGDPVTNVILGSAYFKDMRDYFKGQLPLAIMAYNAGPGNVNKWLKRNGDLELDEFIEKIPLSETRDYVKRVMRTMQVYGNLYNEPFFSEPGYFDFKIEHRFNKSGKGRKKGRRKKK